MEANAALKPLRAIFFDPTPVFCKPICHLAVGQTIQFRDKYHLADDGPRLLVGALVRAAVLTPIAETGGIVR